MDQLSDLAQKLGKNKQYVMANQGTQRLRHQVIGHLCSEAGYGRCGRSRGVVTHFPATKSLYQGQRSRLIFRHKMPIFDAKVVLFKTRRIPNCTALLERMKVVLIYSYSEKKRGDIWQCVQGTPWLLRIKQSGHEHTNMHSVGLCFIRIAR